MAGSGAGTRARDARRRDSRDDERPRPATARAHQAGAGHPPRDDGAARLGRALRDRRSARRNRRDAANVPMRGVEPTAPRCATRYHHRRGPDVPSSAPTRSWSGAARGQFAGSTARNQTWGRTRWTVVGVFESDGGVAEPRSGATRGCCSASTRGNSYQSVLARLDRSQARSRRSRTADRRPAAQRQVRRETEYYAAAIQALTDLIRDDRLRHRRADGHRRGVRRAQDDVPRCRRARARSRRCARWASTRRPSSSRCSPSRSCSAAIGGASAASPPYFASTATRRRR